MDVKDADQGNPKNSFDTLSADSLKDLRIRYGRGDLNDVEIDMIVGSVEEILREAPFKAEKIEFKAFTHRLMLGVDEVDVSPLLGDAHYQRGSLDGYRASLKEQLKFNREKYEVEQNADIKESQALRILEEQQIDLSRDSLTLRKNPMLTYTYSDWWSSPSGGQETYAVSLKSGEVLFVEERSIKKGQTILAKRPE